MLLTRSPLSYPLLDNRVRLACVRHAASVDSEPGSNSHVKFAVWRRRSLRNTHTAQLFNAIADDLALALFSYLCVWMVRRIAAPPPADTRRAVHHCARPCGLRASVDACCACTHYLVFKEPETRSALRRRRFPTDRALPSVLGEPSEVTIATSRCQAPNRRSDGAGCRPGIGVRRRSGSATSLASGLAPVRRTFQ